MSDLETRLTEALRDGAEGAPDALGLADAARVRARARRRTGMAAVGAAAVGALVVPVAVAALGGSDGGKEPVADQPTASDLEPADNGRWESWHGVTVLVPEDWENGNQSAWCADGGSVETFRVTRPGGVSETIACTPASSYGVSFSEIDGKESFEWPVVSQTNEAWPAGTFVGARGMDGVVVMVAGPDREDVIAVLDTVRPITDGVDPNGCSVVDDGGPGLAEDGVVPVCRYDANEDLVQSERLTGEDAATAAAQVLASPLADGGRTCQNGPTEYVVMGVEGRRVEVQFAGNGGCVDRGVFVEGIRHELTEDILFWALSPGWSGEVDGNIPLPPELRQR